MWLRKRWPDTSKAGSRHFVIYRSIGKTGIQVSAIGFGAWGIGGKTPGGTSYGETNDDESRAALKEAHAAGINFFDTSAVYGYGHSEALIGEVFDGCRDDVVIATKAGLTTYGDPADFSDEAIRRSLDGSLQRLRTDYIDLLQLHNPSADVIANEANAISSTFDVLRSQGAVRAFGVSVRTPEDGMLAIEKLRPDAIQVNFNLLDQRARELGLLQVANDNDCAVIGRTPLNFGFLTGTLSRDTTFSSDDHRARWSPEQIAAWLDGADMYLALRGDDTPVEFALRFCLSSQGLTVTIPGMMTVEEVRDNAAAANKGLLDEKTMDNIARIAQEHDFFVARPRDPGKVDD